MMKYLFVLFLILALFIFSAEELTGQATRNKTVMKAYPGCKSGCYYGNPMGIRENGQITLVSKKDLHFECREPEKTGCLDEGTILSPTMFKGEGVHGVYECKDHFWELNPYYMSYPCPPQLGKLDID